MIYDQIKNIELYYGMHKNLNTIIDFIKANDLNKLPIGKTIINNEVHLNIFDYEIKDDENHLFEQHYKYGDIHFTLKNKEYVKVCSLQNLNITENYDEDKDILFGTSSEYLNALIDENHFVITFKEDPHSPKNFASCNKVKKIVFKFLL